MLLHFYVIFQQDSLYQSYKKYCLGLYLTNSACPTEYPLPVFSIDSTLELRKDSIPRNNLLKCSGYIFRPTLVLVKSEMNNYNSIQILKLEISKYYSSLVFTVYKRLTRTQNCTDFVKHIKMVMIGKEISAIFRLIICMACWLLLLEVGIKSACTGDTG